MSQWLMDVAGCGDDCKEWGDGGDRLGGEPFTFTFTFNIAVCFTFLSGWMTSKSALAWRPPSPKNLGGEHSTLVKN